MAERQGFEPWVPVKAQRFSRPPRSTTPAPLRGGLVLIRGLDWPVQGENRAVGWCYWGFALDSPVRFVDKRANCLPLLGLRL